MRYWKMFLLNLQYIFAHPGRSIVWVMIGLIEATIYLAFLRGVIQQHSHLSSWTLSTVSAYYFLLIALGAFLMTHPEVQILRNDVELGQIDSKLLLPFSYYWQNFFNEIPYRIFQGAIGSIFFFGFFFLFGAKIAYSSWLVSITLSIPIIILAYFISFTFKMIVGIIAFLTTDIRGLNELIEITIALFSGSLLPLNLLPIILAKLAFALPFAYIIYYPLMAVLGQLSVSLMMRVLIIQMVWLLFFWIAYTLLWKKVLKHFALGGQ